jgi:hypothetical protein
MKAGSVLSPIQASFTMHSNGYLSLASDSGDDSVCLAARLCDESTDRLSMDNGDANHADNKHHNIRRLTEIQDDLGSRVDALEARLSAMGA